MSEVRVWRLMRVDDEVREVLILRRDGQVRWRSGTDCSGYWDIRGDDDGVAEFIQDLETAGYKGEA